MSHLNDSMTRDLDNAINEVLINFVIIYQFSVPFPYLYTE